MLRLLHEIEPRMTPCAFHSSLGVPARVPCERDVRRGGVRDGRVPLAPQGSVPGQALPAHVHAVRFRHDVSGRDASRHGVSGHGISSPGLDDELPVHILRPQGSARQVQHDQ